MTDKVLEEILAELKKQTKLLSNLHISQEHKMPEEVKDLLAMLTSMIPKEKNNGS